MPKFVPVTDTERSLLEQDADGAEFAAHRQFDNPHSVLKPKKSEQTDRGWAQGEVGWGVQRSFGGEEKDGHAQILRHSEGDNKMVKNSKGLWIRAKEVEPDNDTRSEKRGMGRGNKGISVFEKSSEGHVDDGERVKSRDNEKRFEDRHDDGDCSSKRKQFHDKNVESDDESRHRSSRRRDEGRDRETYYSRRSRDRGHHKTSHRDRDRSLSRDRDRRRKDNRRHNDRRRSRSRSRSRSDSRDRRHRSKRHRADSEVVDSRREDRDHSKKRHRRSHSRSPMSSSDREDRRSSQYHPDTKRQTSSTDQRKSRFDKSAAEEPPLSDPIAARQDLEDEAGSDMIRITAVQVINRFHEVYQSSHTGRLRDLRDLFHTSVSIASLQHPDKVYLEGRDAVLIAFAKTIPMSTPVSKRVFFEAFSKKEDPSEEVTFICDLHRAGTSPGLGDSQHDTFVLYECASAQIVRIWGGNDASGCVQDEDLTLEALITKGYKNWQRVKSIVTKKEPFADNGELKNSWEDAFCHFHNYDRMEVWGM